MPQAHVVYCSANNSCKIPQKPQRYKSCGRKNFHQCSLSTSDNEVHGDGVGAVEVLHREDVGPAVHLTHTHQGQAGHVTVRQLNIRLTVYKMYKMYKIYRMYKMYKMYRMYKVYYK